MAGDLVRWTSRTVTKWDRRLIDEGIELVKAFAGRPALGLTAAGRHAAHDGDAGHGRGDHWPQVHALS